MANDPVENSTENNELTDPKTNQAENAENSSEATEAKVENTAAEETNVAKEEPKAENAEEKTEAKPEPESKVDDSPVETPVSEEKADTTDDAKEEATEVSTAKLDEIFENLKNVKENDGSIEVEVHSRIRGGLRVTYDIMPMFLPASHYSMERNPSESELKDIVGKKLEVKIHEMEEDETGRKTVIVSRKAIVEGEIWDKIVVGEEVEGTVSSIAPFGVFLDLGGIEGLIHISRLAPVHVDDPKKFVQKGEKLKVKVVEVDKEKNRIALSRQEYAPSPWDGISEEIPEGSTVKGKVRRVTNFGAYIELKPGVDGLLRTNEISWTKRIKKPSEVIQNGSEIDVKVVNINEEKQTATLSLKRLTDNPWLEMVDKYSEGTVLQGKVAQVMDEGAIVSINNDFEVDGFMPKSKARPILKGSKLPFNVGDEIEVTVVDVVVDDESLIIAPKMDENVVEEYEQNRKKRQSKPQGGRRPAPQTRKQDSAPASGTSSFSLGDLLSEKSKDKLKNLGN